MRHSVKKKPNTPDQHLNYLEISIKTKEPRDLAMISR